MGRKIEKLNHICQGCFFQFHVSCKRSSTCYWSQQSSVPDKNIALERLGAKIFCCLSCEIFNIYLQLYQHSSSLLEWCADLGNKPNNFNNLIRLNKSNFKKWYKHNRVCWQRRLRLWLNKSSSWWCQFALNYRC